MQHLHPTQTLVLLRQFFGSDQRRLWFITLESNVLYNSFIVHLSRYIVTFTFMYLKSLSKAAVCYLGFKLQTFVMLLTEHRHRDNHKTPVKDRSMTPVRVRTAGHIKLNPVFSRMQWYEIIKEPKLTQTWAETNRIKRSQPVFLVKSKNKFSTADLQKWASNCVSQPWGGKSQRSEHSVWETLVMRNV